MLLLNRSLILTCLLLFSSACSTKSVSEEEVSRVTGLIVEREIVEKAQVQQQRRSNTRVYGSVSSGGGVSIGLGFLVPLLSSDDSNQALVRYKIRLTGGEEQVIYHPDTRFAEGDCIDIIELQDSSKPPRLELSTSSCPSS